VQNVEIRALRADRSTFYSDTEQNVETAGRAAPISTFCTLPRTS
jgi:hypothetical protein